MRLLAFVAVAVSIYTAMYAVVLWGVHPILARHPKGPLFVVSWMAAMIAAPLAVPVLERAGHETAARGLAWVAYSWLGFLFLAFGVFSVVGGWEVLTALGGRLWPALGGLSVRGPGFAWVGVGLSLGAGLYGFWEAERLEVETVRIQTPKLAAADAPIRVVQVSDLHLGLLHRQRVLAKVVERMGSLKPDLVVATGDVVDAQVDHLEELVDQWRLLDPPLGKFAVVGNHEVYAGLDQSLSFLERSGFTVLRDRSVPVGPALTLVGIDDDHARGAPVDEVALLRERPGGRFTVVLKHRPTVAAGATGWFDLQLSGHTHLGQIFPFRFVTALRYPLQDGLYDLPGGAKLYASRGTGTWGPPMRVLAPPEITVFEIVPSERKEVSWPP